VRISALTFFVLLFVSEVSAHPLLNDKEASSYILGSRTKKKIDRLELPVDDFSAQFLETIKATTGEPCSFNVVKNWTEKVESYPALRGNKELLLHATRYFGLVDDVTHRTLLQAYWVMKDVNMRASDELKLPEGEIDPTLKAFKDFSQKRSRGRCLHENFLELMSSYRQQDKNFTVKKLRPLINQAEKNSLITARAKSELLEAIKDGIQNWEYSLAEYFQKKDFLRTQFPNTRPEERSEFVTERAGKLKISHRQKLYTYYSPFQIALMGDIIRKLKTRLESPRIDILIFDNEEEVIESFSLDPMERFRFAIRILRKEMKLLATSTYFTGRQPSYTDLMAAAFETGVVTGIELDEVANLEEIWNPKKTFWDKASVWVRLFGGVLTVVVPPPFGFLPALTIVAIEIFTKDGQTDDQHSLF
jgi:hypothetical protein